ncbi:MAG: YARHG domain-containing protein [Muribaculaceae bacterium]|nr:YARHG domain-containing protein [Muribaculaceae bacterium]
MKRTFSLIFLTMAMIGSMGAREVKSTHFFTHGNSEFAKTITDNMASDLAVRDAKCEVLSVADYLLTGTEQAWCNGLDVITTMYHRDKHYVHRSNYLSFGQTPFDPLKGDYELVEKGGKVTVKGTPALTVSIEKYGHYVLMVFRDANHKPVKAYYHFDFDEARNSQRWIKLIHYMLAGNYPLPGDEREHTVVFGPKMSYYTGYKYDSDPGFYDIFVDRETYKIQVIYGFGRVNHGDPSSPKYGKMPGGGGAGALMGPMEWQVTPTVEGLNVKVTRDEKFVDHSPRVCAQGEERNLPKAQTPYEGLDGKWTFASVFPLTPALLKLFPKEVLKLMRGEIYARYGDTFADPDTQAYFDAQPWYQKRPGEKITLTDIERFNYTLIKQAER